MSLAWQVKSETAGVGVPAGWEVRRVRDLVSARNGHPFPSDAFGPSGDLPLVRIRDLGAREFETYVSGDVPQSALLQNGDVVIGMDGDFNLQVWDRGPAALNQRMCALRPEPDVDIRFVAYALPEALEIINDLTFSTTVKHLSTSDVLGERIAVPDLEGQRRIADFLDTETTRIDQLVSASVRLETKLMERRRAQVLSAVSGAEFPDRKESNLPWTESLPSHWPEVRLGLLARMGSGHTPSRSRPEWWTDCTIPWITTGEVQQIRDDRREDLVDTREMISQVGLQNSAAELHPKGTVVLCRTASAGYSAVMGRDMATSQDFVTWTCGPLLDPYFLLWCLRAMRPDLLGRLAMGSTHKTIYVPDLQALKIPLPEIAEQRALVENIRAANAVVDNLVDKVERQVALLSERRRALITAAVTGQFDVSTASGRNTTQGV
ncbi:restriction endonuclease subunit S [Nocardia sp. X0981]